MEGIWVRSQNKEVLVYSNDFVLCEDEDNEMYEIGDNTYRLGDYSTKEKALSVLDDLMHLINSYRGVNGVPVYLMPDDD